ncbi:type IV pilus modification protein PilV [Ramlibacter tataouinensis]|uniref:type IV pilus modification protein PilV n=1 Tax=Ramlibacter tataouinensis TaxID=94132 RepID=UPI0022F37EF4|nr:type IV pilus modification protein PilV [Ramlibacter tataouinensis]WBY01578.1 type IV pilus modification protein PilV [Ramlibacter tataouinensis]
MTRMRTHRRSRAQRGATMIEVLVSLVILMVGLLGLVGVMIQSQRSQLESYQRVQALLLVQDMATRLKANRSAADCYVLASFLGTGNTTIPTACGSGSRGEHDLTQWRDLLLGAAELSNTDQVGGILGARGCITKDASNLFQVSVAWQGLSATTAPPAGVTCGQGEYGSSDALRRAVSVTVQFGI